MRVSRSALSPLCASCAKPGRLNSSLRPGIATRSTLSPMGKRYESTIATCSPRTDGLDPQLGRGYGLPSPAMLTDRTEAEDLTYMRAAVNAARRAAYQPRRMAVLAKKSFGQPPLFHLEGQFRHCAAYLAGSDRFGTANESTFGLCRASQWDCECSQTEGQDGRQFGRWRRGRGVRGDPTQSRGE